MTAMDSYARTTQLFPAAAVLAPVTLAALACFRMETLEEITRSLAYLALAAGIHVVVMRLVRDRGNAVQESLWRQWGGSPTLLRLQWSGNTHSVTARRHRRVQALTGVVLPDREEEAADPDNAKEVYEDAVSRMRELTRNRENYPRVFSELVGYGTARNLYGVKPAGIGLSAATLLASGTGAVLNIVGATGLSWWAIGITGVGSIALIAGWLSVVTARFVKTAADRYADALLSTAPEPGAALAQ